EVSGTKLFDRLTEALEGTSPFDIFNGDVSDLLNQLTTIASDLQKQPLSPLPAALQVKAPAIPLTPPTPKVKRPAEAATPQPQHAAPAAPAASVEPVVAPPVAAPTPAPQPAAQATAQAAATVRPSAPTTPVAPALSADKAFVRRLNIGIDVDAISDAEA